MQAALNILIVTALAVATAPGNAAETRNARTPDTPLTGNAPALSVVKPAGFSADGQLLFPADFDRWITLGASIGMGYNEQDFDPDNPGSFVTVSMPVDAYEYFKRHRKFADGTLFARRSYGAVQRLANNRAGFVMGEAGATEIHLIDRQRFRDGFNFAVFMNGQKQAPLLPEGNGCISCHKSDGAFQNTFAQFYPAIRHDIPRALLESSLKRGHVKLQ